MYDDFPNWKFLEFQKFSQLSNIKNFRKWTISEIGLSSRLVNNKNLIISEILKFGKLQIFSSCRIRNFSNKQFLNIFEFENDRILELLFWNSKFGTTSSFANFHIRLLI